MNIKKTAMTNAANLYFFMVNFNHALLQRFRQYNMNYIILDLKALYHGYRNDAETIKMLPKKLDAILLTDIFEQIARLGSIHLFFKPAASP